MLKKMLFSTLNGDWSQGGMLLLGEGLSVTEMLTLVQISA